MAKKSQKSKKLAAELSARKDAVDIFLIGILVLSTWKDQDGAQQAKIFGLMPGDYKLMAWSLTKVAGALVMEDQKRQGNGKLIEMSDRKIVRP